MKISIKHHPEYPLCPWHVVINDFWTRVFLTEAEAKAYVAGLADGACMRPGK